jgi:hypothetical protein
MGTASLRLKSQQGLQNQPRNTTSLLRQPLHRGLLKHQPVLHKTAARTADPATTSTVIWRRRRRVPGQSSAATEWATQFPRQGSHREPPDSHYPESYPAKLPRSMSAG